MMLTMMMMCVCLCVCVHISSISYADEFDKKQTGRELIEEKDNLWVLLKECLFRYKKFENKEEKDTAIRELKRVAGSLMQKHTLANLGKGKFRSLVAKCISESDLSLEVEPFARFRFSRTSALL